MEIPNQGLNCFLSPTNVRTGYGNLQYEIFKSMIKDLNIDLKPINPGVYIQDRENSETWYQSWMNGNYEAKKIEVYPKCLSINYPTQLGSLSIQTSYVMSMWESERLPKFLVDCLNNHDIIMVPCEHNIDVFKNSGVKIPIFKVPLGNNQEKYHFLSRDWNITHENPFTFCVIGAINWRKGTDLAMKAFKKVFPSTQKDVRLIVKVSKQYTPPWVISGMRTSDERILLIKESLSDLEMLNLYGASHCYVGCSRGDAWNLLAFQALATGMPSICTTYCGPEEYKDITFPLSWDYKYCNEKVFGEDWGWYGEPNFDHLCELMEYAYKNPDVCLKKGIEASNLIKDKYTWTETARKILNVIESN